MAVDQSNAEWKKPVDGDNTADMESPYTYIQYTADLRSNEVRVMQALERIAAALEKMVGDNQEEKDGDIT